MEKVQWNSIDKKQNGLKYSKNDESSTLPRKTNNNDLLEKDGGAKNCIYKD